MSKEIVFDLEYFENVKNAIYALIESTSPTTKSQYKDLALLCEFIDTEETEIDSSCLSNCDIVDLLPKHPSLYKELHYRDQRDEETYNPEKFFCCYR